MHDTNAGGTSQQAAPVIAPEPTPLCCPQCQSEDGLATVEELAGNALAKFYEVPGGKREIDYEGETIVNWDSSTTVGIVCRECGWSSTKPNAVYLLARVGDDEAPELEWVIENAAHAYAEQVRADGGLYDGTQQADLIANERFRSAVEVAWKAGRRFPDGQAG